MKIDRIQCMNCATYYEDDKRRCDSCIKNIKEGEKIKFLYFSDICEGTIINIGKDWFEVKFNFKNKER